MKQPSLSRNKQSTTVSFMGSRIIAMINQKGGVGKTTSVQNIGAGLHQLGKKVLLIDLDAQANLSYSMGIDADQLRYTVCDLLKGQADLQKVIIEQDGVSLIPASANLSAAEIELSSGIGREALLKKALKSITNFDVILLDCPPNMGFLTLNALAAASEIFVPLQPEFLSIMGLKKLMNMLEKIKQSLNPNLRISGIITTQFDTRLKLHNEVFAGLQQHFEDKLFKTYIRRNITLAEATSYGKSIMRYAPKSYGAQDYLALSKEVLARWRENG